MLGVGCGVVGGVRKVVMDCGGWWVDGAGWRMVGGVLCVERCGRWIVEDGAWSVVGGGWSVVQGLMDVVI